MVRFRLIRPAAFALFSVITASLFAMHATFVPITTAGFTTYTSGTLAASWGDYNNDDFLDLTLYKNNGDGTFADIPGFRSLLNNGNYHGSSWCDYDRDGYPDIAILGYESGPSLLLHNKRDGTFENVAPQFGMDIIGGGETPIWGDYDGDGFPDLFTPYYTYQPPYRMFLFHNNTNGTFTDVAEEAGVTLPNIPLSLRPEGAMWADVDDDGDLDFYTASHLMINDGEGHFTDARAAMGLPQAFDEGASFVDYNNDGRLDLYIRTLTTGRLFRNDGGTFTEVTASVGIPAGGAVWGDTWADVDNDGDLDLLYFRSGQATLLLLNQGNGTLVADPTFTALNLQADNSAWGDYDNDGDLDFVASTFAKRLFQNQLDLDPFFPNSWLRVKVVDSDGYMVECGATVRLRRVDIPSAAVQTRVVDGGGSGYLSQGQYSVHFGVVPVGTYCVEISFPSAHGRKVVVDPTVNPALCGIYPTALANKEIIVYRGGTAIIDGVTYSVPTAVSSSLWTNYE